MSDEPASEPDDFNTDYDDDLEDDDDLEEDCGKGPDGQCSYAGSEFCDWDCPLERAKWRREKSA